ncbi:ModD protein [Sulfurimonas sp.]|uniref:ModD protein n=1 Tax=Sulfurimonas sp. TaxID=2022749 RepID=UPI0025F78347|nr:ModD protein [Sulfurimonas sp.]MBW6488593.1 ModD protein [Sulfurimonas sp.]
MDLLFEDGGYFDLTTFGLGIGVKEGSMSFAPKSEIILSGCDEVEKIVKKCGLKYRFLKKNGDMTAPKETILECSGNAKSLHHAWKISQNIFEYMSGIATYTDKMLQLAKAINPDIAIITTRKNFPGSKELMLKAVMDGGGAPHRLGLYDSILIFEQHLVFLSDKQELERSFKTLKRKFIEKKITAEVDNPQDAHYFASLGVDILQCEKMDFKMLKECVKLKEEFKNITISATGGINLENVTEFAKTGVDLIVTSSPYHAKPLDIKVEMGKL